MWTTRKYGKLPVLTFESLSTRNVHDFQEICRGTRDILLNFRYEEEILPVTVAKKGTTEGGNHLKKS